MPNRREVLAGAFGALFAFITPDILADIAGHQPPPPHPEGWPVEPGEITLDVHFDPAPPVLFRLLSVDGYKLDIEPALVEHGGAPWLQVEWHPEAELELHAVQLLLEGARTEEARFGPVRVEPGDRFLLRWDLVRSMG